MINGMAYFLSNKSAGGERITKDIVELMLQTFFSVVRAEQDLD
jgi:hypothetical protein